MKAYVIFYITGNSEVITKGVLLTTYEISLEEAVMRWRSRQINQILADETCYYAEETDISTF